MSTDEPQGPRAGTRKRLGPIDGSPVTKVPNLSALSSQQRALRLAALQEFEAKKVKKFFEKQVEHINTNRQLVEGIKFLFDERGQPPPNAPIEDIVEERRNIEYQIRWFDAILKELRNQWVKVKEIEDYALERLNLPLSGEE